jgi:hypothetical protein
MQCPRPWKLLPGLCGNWLALLLVISHFPCWFHLLDGPPTGYHKYISPASSIMGWCSWQQHCQQQEVAAIALGILHVFSHSLLGIDQGGHWFHTPVHRQGNWGSVGGQWLAQHLIANRGQQCNLNLDHADSCDELKERPAGSAGGLGNTFGSWFQVWGWLQSHQVRWTSHLVKLHVKGYIRRYQAAGQPFCPGCI